jgi:hypothetical protein
VNALRGTALAGVEVAEVLLVLLELLPAPIPELIAFTGGVSTVEDGVNATDVVVALEPADEDPEDAKDEDAPGPEAPEDAPV